MCTDYDLIYAFFSFNHADYVIKHNLPENNT